MRVPLVFIRHGETDWNRDLRFQGQRDIPLNPRGRRQAARNGRAVAGILREGKWQLIASPLGRAVETMEITLGSAGEKGRWFATDPMLMEANYGEWEGLTLDDIARRHPKESHAREVDKWGYAPPNGESYALPAYDRDALLIEVSLFPDWFAGRGGEAPFTEERRTKFLAAWMRLLEKVDPRVTTWVMRDFHSPNILWQAGAAGISRVGVIDFQDALIGHPAYDVASLAQDARVAIDEATEAQLKARYREGRKARDELGFDATAFDIAYDILALQRATKVLGGFARLAYSERKTGYQRHRGRLKALLRRNLAHSVLSDMRLWYEPYL